MPLEKSTSGIKSEDENEGVSLYTYTFSAGNGAGGNGTSQLLLQNNLTDDTNMFLQGLEDGTTGWTFDGLPVLFPTDGQPILHQLAVEESDMSESEIQESTPIIDTSKEITIFQQQAESENQINQNENIIFDKEEEEEEEEEPLTEILTENANLISSVVTENGDTESTIEIPGKGFFTVSGLIFPIQQRKSIEDSNQIFQMENDSDETTLEDSNQNSIEISELADVITAYKCKSCDYTGTDKDLFLDHYREFHLNNIQLVTLQDENATQQYENIIVQSDSEAQSEYFLETDEGTYELNTHDVQTIGINGDNFEHLATNGGNKVIETIEEKYILVCSQCKKGFDSIDACKQHMIDDHKLRELSAKSEQRPKIISIVNNTISNSTQVNNTSEIEVNVDVESETDANGKSIIVDDPRDLFEKTILKIRKKNASLAFKCHVRGCSCKFATDEIRIQHEKCHVRIENSKTNDTANGGNGGGNIAYKCSECGILQKSWRSTSLHLWRAHSIQTDLITCPVCNVYKATLTQLEHHMMTHSDKKSYCCSECGKFYKQASQLRNHRVIHLDKTSDKRPLWYREKECEQCHKIFSNSKSLKKHLQSVHSKLKPFICNVCGHSCARKAMLQMHLRQHTGEKPYSCDFCNYRTGDHNSLRRHKMKHSGIRPYKCPHCPYTSIQSNAYKYHISIKHPGKPGVFLCNICAFKSVSEEVYINHLNDHKQGIIPLTKTTKTVSTTNSNGGNNKNDTSKTVYFYHDATKKEVSTIIPEVKVSTNNEQRKLSVCSDNEEPCYLQYDQLTDEQCIDTGGITIPAEPECSSLLQLALLS